MKILIFWDIYWRIWRKAIKKELPILKNKYKPDFIIANVDNISSGRGAIEKHILEIKDYWIDLFTSWDHIFDNYDRIKDYIEAKDSDLIIAANLYNNIDLKNLWYKVIEKNSKKLLVIHLQSETFMPVKVSNPFLKAREILDKFKKEDLDWIIIDFHKEATSEWYWMSFYLNGEVSFIFWTHTHVQTNDDFIFDFWTWLISDVWMSWPLNSVIWANYASVEKIFLTWINKWKKEQSLDKNYVVNGVFVEIEDKKCKSIEKIRIRNSL